MVCFWLCIHTTTDAFPDRFRLAARHSIFSSSPQWSSSLLSLLLSLPQLGYSFESLQPSLLSRCVSTALEQFFPNSPQLNPLLPPSSLHPRNQQSVPKFCDLRNAHFVLSRTPELAACGDVQIWFDFWTMTFPEKRVLLRRQSQNLTRSGVDTGRPWNTCGNLWRTPMILRLLSIR